MKPCFGLPSVIAALALLSAGCAHAEPEQLDEHHWRGVERVVAIGDLHGDWEQYQAILRAAGLTDERARWSGGMTHLVQTGDVVDRGPDSRRIIDDLQRLAKQARRKGGQVHTLVGNHEAMNVVGDLRYVHPGEYASFTDRESERLRQRYYEGWMRQLEQTNPEAFLAIQADRTHYERWMAEHPPGWVEHRFAWAPDGDYGRWVLENPVAVVINDTLFVHGGISPEYCSMPLGAIDEKLERDVRQFDPDAPGMTHDELSPFWYRGLAEGDEAAMQATVGEILDCAGVDRIVVGHTPTPGVIWPRFDGRVVLIDTGIAKAYEGRAAWLELGPDGPVAGYLDGELPLPADAEGREDYLHTLVDRRPGDFRLAAFRDALQDSKPAVEAGEEPGESPGK